MYFEPNCSNFWDCVFILKIRCSLSWTKSSLFSHQNARKLSRINVKQLPFFKNSVGSSRTSIPKLIAHFHSKLGRIMNDLRNEVGFMPWTRVTFFNLQFCSNLGRNINRQRNEIIPYWTRTLGSGTSVLNTSPTFSTFGHHYFILT